MSSTLVETVARPAPPRLGGWDGVELWVGNARSSAAMLLGTFGFRCTAYAGPETGVRDRVSYVVEQGDIRVVVAGGLTEDSPIALHHHLHGDGVKHLAWRVDDVDGAFDAVVARGAVPVREPWTEAEGPARDLLVAVMSWVSGFERDRLVERINAGLARARREGKSLGRPRTRPARVLVARLRERGMSWAEVAAKLGCSSSAARRALTYPREPNQAGVAPLGGAQPI